MTQKEVGYVELEWTCPVCKTRNPGTQKICSGCGAAQPANVKFEAPGQSDLITDPATIDAAKAGPDIHCAFCGARNPATAKTCHKCGADLTQGKAREAGEVVGAYSSALIPELKCPSCGQVNPASAKMCTRCGAPLGKPQPASQAALAVAPPTGGSGSIKLIFIAIGALVVIGLCAFVFMGFQTSDKTATANQARWERNIDIVGLVPVRSSAWRDAVPERADNIACRREFRYSTSQPQPGALEVCGTPYTVDTGTGVGRVVQDCEYQAYDDMCSYTTNQWVVVNTVTSQGVGFSPNWPAASLVGDQKLGNRSEHYVCDVSDGKNSYSFPLHTLDEYAQCQLGTEWKVEVNTFGGVVSAEPAK